MKFFKDWDESMKLLFWVFMGGLFFLAISFFSKFDLPKVRKASKKAIARAYRVEIKIFKKWINKFGSSFQRKLISGRERNLPIVAFIGMLGKPSDRPKYKGKPVVSKADIWKASGHSDSTVYHKIRNLENPEDVIKMSYKTYQSLNYFPPRHTKLILDFLKNGVTEQTDFSPVFDPDETISDPKLP